MIRPFGHIFVFELNNNLSSLSSKLGVYAISTYVSSTNTFSFQSRFDSIGVGASRQTVKIFGIANNVLIDGTLTIASVGTCNWTGTGTVTATINSSGIVTVTLPTTAFDVFTLISGEKISK